MIRTDAARTTWHTPDGVDAPILVSNLVAGSSLLVVLTVLSWPLAVMGAAYVVAASVFLAAVYARPALTRRQEVGAWLTSWLAAVALWTFVLAAVEGGTPFLLLTARAGVVVATPCFLVWQAAALAVRQLVAVRAKRPSA